jgi:cytochrome P450
MTETTVGTVTPGTEYPFVPMTPQEASAQYCRIAADRPMTRMTMPVGGDAWIIHRNEAARAMLSDPRFVRKPFRTGERVVPYFVEFPEFLKTTLQFQDPPEHTKLRRLVQRAISPKSVRSMRESAVAFANELIDAMVAKGGPIDLVHEYALPLPIQMLSNLLGVPPEDHEKFEKWSSSTLAVANMSMDEIAANMMELVVYMTELIEQRRREPKDDLLSMLANARDQDDSLTDDEILPIALILIIGGFDNTANFICTGVLSLLHNDEQRALLLTDVDGLMPTAAEEVLRHAGFETGGMAGGGGALVPFVASEDVEIDGQLIAAGEAVMIDPSAVSHDGIALPDPERYDITRQNNPHLTLSYGLHHCLGAPLARMELQVGIGELFKRLPALRVAGEVTYNRDHLSQPMTQLPVTW